MKWFVLRLTELADEQPKEAVEARLRQWFGVTVHVFEGYAFVQEGAKRPLTSSETESIVALTLPDQEVQRLISGPPIRVGAEVLVKFGRFQGLRGIVVAVHKGDMLSVRVTLRSRQTLLHLRRRDVKHE